MANIKLTGHTWDTSGIYDAEQEKTQAEVNSGVKTALVFQSDLSKGITAWEYGSLGSGGEDTPRTYEIRTNAYISIDKIDEVVFSRELSSRLCFYTSKSRAGFIVRESLTNVDGINIKSFRMTYPTAKYFRFTIYINNTTDQTDASLADNVTFNVSLCDYTREKIYDNVVSVKNFNTTYYGEKFPFRKNTVNFRKIINVDASIASQVLNGIAVYENYLVVGYNPGLLRIYNVFTGAKLKELNITGTPHFNCLSFSKTKASDSDLFPLLYAETEDENNTYYVIRISDINPATIVKKYIFPTEDFGLTPQIGWDFDNNRAYSFGRVNSTSENFVFTRIDMTDETDNGDDTYSLGVISQGESIGFGVRQDCQFHSGRLYMLISNQTSPYNPHIISVACDAVNAVITSCFPTLPWETEGEGLSIYTDTDGISHLYVCDVTGDLWELYEN